MGVMEASTQIPKKGLRGQEIRGKLGDSGSHLKILTTQEAEIRRIMV
jgi:hypothetical protein